MKSRVLTTSIVLLTLLTIVGSVQAQTGSSDSASSLATLGAALAAGHYLDAYNEVFVLNDSAPAELIDAMAAEPEVEADQQVRVFLLLFSGHPAQALTQAEALTESALSFAVKAAANSIIGNTDDASAALSMALERTSDDAQLYGLMAAAGFVQGNSEQVLENSGRAVEIDPDLAGAYRLRGIGKLRSGDPEAALLDANHAIELDPTVYFYRYLRANIYFAFGDPEAALREVDAALALNPRSYLGHALRAGANTALGNLEQAALDFANSVDVRTNEVIGADSLISGAPVQVAMTFGRTFQLSFEARAAQMLSINVNSVNPDEVDPVMLIVSPEGTPLIFNDDANDDSLDAEITDYTLPESGTYTLVVSHANAGSEGDLEVLISLR